MATLVRRGLRFASYLWHGGRGRLSRALTRLRIRWFGTAISAHAYRRSLARPLLVDRVHPPFLFDVTDRTRLVQALRRQFPTHDREVIAAADRYLTHTFDLLGSGPVDHGRQLRWREDVKTGYIWDRTYWPEIIYWEETKAVPYDVKVPWELSRCQWFPTLGQAYWLTGDERYAREMIELIEDWIADNPPELGPNWCVSMEVAIRATNWLVGYAFIKDSSAVTQDFLDRFGTSLLAHARHIMANLEVSEAPGNHYVSNGAGLVFLGLLLPEFVESRQWLKTGLEILTTQLDRQILPDGVDYEMSTSYHRLMLELFAYPLLLLERHGHAVTANQRQVIRRMLGFVMSYTQPDGSIVQVGDNDNGRFLIFDDRTWQSLNDHRYLLALGALKFGDGSLKTGASQSQPEAFWLLGGLPATVWDEITALPLPATQHFPNGGFASWRQGNRSLLLRCGGVGRAGWGGHSHNDLGSLAYFSEQAWIVDPGTGTYTAEPEVRNRFRSVRSHSTIEIDGREPRSLKDHGLFTLRSDGMPVLGAWQPKRQQWQIDARFNETGPVTCRRTIAIGPHGLKIVDRVDASDDREHTATVRFVLDPAVRVEQTATDVVLRRSDCQRSLRLSSTGTAASMGPMTKARGWYSEGYGRWQMTITLIVSLKFLGTASILTTVEELP
ncbi:alginate lyase family protein [Candidatus Berkelbacteria bacterium]|nr:alginate lyase family protein [Candidatus Berkelbacteria bacterium]